jgi:hypothetical protein
MPRKQKLRRAAGLSKNLPTGKGGYFSSAPRISRTQATSRTATVNGHGVLRSVLEAASADIGCSLSDLNVLSAQKDPYRLDTPSGHRDGSWVAEQLKRLVGREKRIHWRGLHYAIVAEGGIRKPDGGIYVNSNDDWEWLQDVAGKAARWLGYIPFPRITDNRNAEPFIHHEARVSPEAFVSIGLDVQIPGIEDLEPRPLAHGFDSRQAFHFVVFGEKASLEDVVLPIARARQADLYLSTGEISDTLLYRIAQDDADDGRPMVVFCLTDCDPAGHQMPVSIGRKLQAFRDLLFPKLQFEVVPVALSVEQVRELGLPSTPLKETEKRADRWREAFGVEQTEIDALATLRPAVLREIIERAFDPYWDHTLPQRVREAEDDWNRRAQEALGEQIDQEHLEALREEAAGRLTELDEAIADINERLQLAAADRFALPEIEVPEPEVDEDATRQRVGFFRGRLGGGDPRSDPTESLCELNRGRAMIEKLPALNVVQSIVTRCMASRI